VLLTATWTKVPALVPSEQVELQELLVTPLEEGHPQNCVGETLVPDKDVELLTALEIALESYPFASAYSVPYCAALFTCMSVYTPIPRSAMQMNIRTITGAMMANSTAVTPVVSFQSCESTTWRRPAIRR